MQNGICRLCCQRKDLVEAHIWPKFVYKRYVSDIKEGGVFLDLGKGRRTNKQYKEFWFCETCDNETLAQWEGNASKLCASLDKRPMEPLPYDNGLLPFLVSVSWRTAMLDVQQRGVKGGKHLDAALKHWRQFLRHKKTSVDPYTQHVFVIVPAHPEIELHKAAGGQVFPENGLVLSQIGPLWIVGLYDRRRLPVSDLRIWNQSQIHPSGGNLKAIEAWRVGGNVTLEFAKILSKREALTKKQLLDLFVENPKKR